MRVGDGSELAFSRSEPALSNRSGSMTWIFSGGCFRRHLQVVKFLKTDSHIRQKLHWRLWRTDGQARFQTLGPSPSLVLRPPSARRPSVAHAPRLSCAPRSFPCMPSVCASFRLVRVACARPAYRALPARILVLRLAFVLVTCPRSARRASNLRLRTHFCYHVLPSRQGGCASREYLAVPLPYARTARLQTASLASRYQKPTRFVGFVRSSRFFLHILSIVWYYLSIAA